MARKPKTTRAPRAAKPKANPAATPTGAEGATPAAPPVTSPPAPPSPPPPPKKGDAIVVTGPKQGRYRAGRKFDSEPVSIPLADLTDDELAAIKADPRLQVVDADD